MMLILGTISVLTGNLIIFFISVLISLTVFFLRSWNKHIFDKLTVSRYFEQEKVQAGQEVEYFVEIENRKILPIIAMRLVSTLSTDLKFLDKKTDYVDYKLNKRFRDAFSLKWYEKIKRKYILTAKKRGLNGIFSANLEYYDPFGFFENHQEDGERVKLYVYPRILPVLVAKTEYSMLFGTRMSKGWIFQDKLNKVGVRPYRSTDSFKDINWKSSARSMQLQSDIYKPSLDREVHIFHGLNTEEKWWLEDNANILELSLVCAASLCDKYFRDNFAVGFYSTLNSISESRGDYTSIEVSANNEQRELIYTVMSLLNSNSIINLAKVLEIERQKINPGATIIIIADSLEDKLRMIINHLKNKYQINLVTIDDLNNENQRLHMPGIRQFFLKEGNWDEIEKIELYN